MDEKQTTLRRTVVFGAAAGYIVLGAVHPDDPDVGDDATFFIVLHVIQPVLIGLLGWGLWLLVEGLPGRAAQIARVAVIPYVIVYTVFDSIAGIAMGLLARQGTSMGGADAAAVQRLIDELHDLPFGFVLYLAAGLSWLFAALAVAVAVKQVGGVGPSTVMALGAAVFAVGHPFPPGPTGMALFAAGVLWLELRRRPVPEPSPEFHPALTS
jgi:uncharacterized membrane-anchored protein YitT (DUF2179 family)